MTEIIGYNQENLEIVHLYVKKIFTNVTKTYTINSNAPLKVIMEYILNKGEDHFQIDKNTIKELVEAGQSIPGIQSEYAPALELDTPNETFKQRFPECYKGVAFYIRTVVN